MHVLLRWHMPTRLDPNFLHFARPPPAHHKTFSQLGLGLGPGIL